MSIRKSSLAACAVAVFTVLIVTWGYAATASRLTYLSFGGPVSLPGVTLAAGTYTFERALPGEDVHLVRVSSRDQKTVYLTAFTHLVGRPDGLPLNRHIVLGEAKRGMAPPIKVWFPIGDRQGHEFVYDSK